MKGTRSWPVVDATGRPVLRTTDFPDIRVDCIGDFMQVQLVDPHHAGFGLLCIANFGGLQVTHACAARLQSLLELCCPKLARGHALVLSLSLQTLE